MTPVMTPFPQSTPAPRRRSFPKTGEVCADGAERGETGFPQCAASPCGSCPYRRDVPAGLWDASEYHKLASYDGETWAQSPALFLCHQQNGHLCAGWVACHDVGHLLALRLHPVDPSVFAYQSPVPVFGSGAEARDHGLSGVARPGPRARRAIRGLVKKSARRARTAPAQGGPSHA